MRCVCVDKVKNLLSSPILSETLGLIIESLVMLTEGMLILLPHTALEVA